MATTDLKAWARLGATQRLIELSNERDALLAAFPDLNDEPKAGIRRRGRPRKIQESTDATTVSAAVVPRRKRRTISPEGKARIAAAQRLRWKKHKAAAKKAKQPAA